MYNCNELLQKIDLTYARIMEELEDNQQDTTIVNEAFQDFYKNVRANNDITRKYLVTMDGYKKYYGSYVDFVGLFNTRDEAEKAIDECLKYAESLEINIRKEDYKIFEVDEGWWHYPHKNNSSDRYETIHTDMPLGGYEE